MTGNTLAGVGVVVTRPAHQAEDLCRLIEEAGGHALRFPVMEIVDAGDGEAVDELLGRLDGFDIAVFISANAVDKAMSRIKARGPLPPGLRIAAIGKASARELRRFGVAVDILPAGRFDSEALLETEAMGEVAGRRIVIFRGEGGRELLADTLRARGAEVEYAEVYRRARPSGDVDGLMRRWARGEVDVIVVTSNEGLRNLFEMVGGLGRAWLRKTPLVVVSERMVQLAGELGFERPPVVAAEASDAGLLKALEEWRRREKRDERD